MAIYQEQEFPFIRAEPCSVLICHRSSRRMQIGSTQQGKIVLAGSIIMLQTQQTHRQLLDRLTLFYLASTLARRLKMLGSPGFMRRPRAQLQKLFLMAELLEPSLFGRHLSAARTLPEPVGDSCTQICHLLGRLCFEHSSRPCLCPLSGLRSYSKTKP